MKTTLIFSKLRNRIREGMWNIQYYSNQSGLVPPSFSTLEYNAHVRWKFLHRFRIRDKMLQMFFSFPLSFIPTFHKLYYPIFRKIYEVMKFWVPAEEVWGLKNLEIFESSLETVHVISSLLCVTHGLEHGTLNLFTSRGIVGQVFYTFHHEG